MGIDAWTADKPNASGWYWNRINGTVGIALIMRRDCQLYAWLKFEDAWLNREGWLDYTNGEWLGPLSPTDRQQGRVAGLREAHVFAMEAGALYTAHRISALIDKAQQAQEGGVGDGK